MCAKGFYRRHEHLPVTECIACGRLRGINCPLNATLETLRVVRGYWRLSSTSLEARRCVGSELDSPCVGGTDLGIEGEGYCRDGHKGPRCELCTNTSQYYSQGSCFDCPEVVYSSSLFISIFVGMLAAVLGIPVAAARYTPRSYRAVTHFATRSGAWVSYLALIPKLKLCAASAPNQQHSYHC